MKKIVFGLCILFLLTGCQPDPLSPSSPLETQEEAVAIDSQGVVETMEDGQQKVAISPDIPDSDLLLSSPVFEDAGALPSQYTCDGENTFPPLNITGVPEGTRSLMLIMSNPHYENRKFVHWSVWNFHPQTKLIDKNAFTPQVTQGINDFGTYVYEGPCPEVGERVDIVFELWALDTRITRSVRDWTAGHLMINTMGHILGKSVLTAHYNR